jgi:hypothetical protein
MTEGTKKPIFTIVIIAVVLIGAFYILSISGAKKPEIEIDEDPEKPKGPEEKKPTEKVVEKTVKKIIYDFVPKWEENDDDFEPDEDPEEAAILSIGDYSKEVAEMQRRMIELGSSVKITGKFDDFTANELKEKLGIDPEKNVILGNLPSN